MEPKGTAAGVPPPSPRQTFRTADVARILRVAPVRVRAIVRAGLCQPARRGRAFEFSFQDLVLVRTAHGLLQAQVPPRRVRRALRALARQLPPDRPLSAVRLYADGRSVVVRDGHAAWQPESGQTVFTFDVAALARRAGVIPVPRRRPGANPPPDPAKAAAGWFARALALESVDVDAAQTAYRRALELDPEMSDAYINLGRLVHVGGNAATAMQYYREALARSPGDPVAHFDLAVALEDLADPATAIVSYRRAVALDPDFADAHFNLSRLLDHLGQRAQALRHLLTYKKLIDVT